MRLKPLNWIDSQQENWALRCWANTKLGFLLEVLRHPKQGHGWWQVSSEENGTHVCGTCMGPPDGKQLAEEAYLKLIMDQLEDEHEVVAAPRTGLDRDRGDSWGSD